jgi:hypothetical protein
MEPQQPFLPSGTGFSPFAAGSPQNPSLGGHAGDMGPASSLGRYRSLSSQGGMGFPSPDQTSATASPALMQPAIAAAELLSNAGCMSSRSASATLAAAGRQLSAGNAFQNPPLQFYQHQQQHNAGMSSPWRSLGRIDSGPDDALAAAVAAAGLAPPPPPPPYSSNTASPLSRSSTTSAQLLLQQQQLQQAALARSLSVDVGSIAGGGYLAGNGRWGSGRLQYDAPGAFGGSHDHQGRFGSVYDMKRCVQVTCVESSGPWGMERGF